MLSGGFRPLKADRNERSHKSARKQKPIRAVHRDLSPPPDLPEFPKDFYGVVDAGPDRVDPEDSTAAKEERRETARFLDSLKGDIDEVRIGIIPRSASAGNFKVVEEDDTFGGLPPKRKPTQEKERRRMSWFKRKQNKEGKKKMEHQLHTARIAPDITVDLSGCDISQVPDGVYALCKVLLKQVLLLHDNRLTSLKETGSNYDEFVKLGASIRVLDVHNNEIKDLPAQIRSLKSLQVLNISQNQMQDLPSEIGQLAELQTLNLKGNHLSTIPETIGNLRSLRTLDISDNSITQLPLALSRLQCLETIVLDADQMIYPSAATCRLGTSAIMKQLCLDAGVNYRAPAERLLPLMRERGANSFSGLETVTELSNGSPASGVSPRTRVSCQWSDAASLSQGQLDLMEQKAMHYERLKEARRKEQLKMQQALLESHAQHVAMVAQSNQNRVEILNRIANEQGDIDHRISKLQSQRDAEKRTLLDAIRTMENHTSTLISKILSMNREIQWTERTLEADEHKRLVEDEWFKVRREEYERLRRGEIETAMGAILAENFSLEKLRLRQEKAKGAAISRYFEEEQIYDDNVETALASKDEQMERLVSDIDRDQRLQMNALLALMEQRDARTNRLNSQIELLYKELAQLSQLEMKSKDARVANEQECLEGQRGQLMRLLMQLIDERSSRGKELQRRLKEMEKANEDHLIDYWLIQYQKLLDSKPQQLVDEENAADVELIKVLEKAGGIEYLPSFVRHNVTCDTLASLTEHDLQRIGIYQVGLRKRVLEAITDLVPTVSKGKGRPAARDMDRAEASAAGPSYSPSTTPRVLAARFEVECVICLDMQASMLFIPCGHVCSCAGCSSTLLLCPLCRQSVTDKIDLTLRAPSAPPLGETPS